MRRKPMLLHKVIEQKKKKGREVFGLVGTHRGAGVTQTGLMLALYLGEELDKKTAFLEVNDHHDISLLQSVYEWSSEDDISFSYHNVTFYKDVKLDQIAELLNNDYDSFVIDFGTEITNIKNELLRCGTKIVIGSQVEWRQYKLIQFIKSVQAIKGNDKWLYALPYATQKTINNLRNELDRLFYSIPFELKPMVSSKGTLRFFNDLLCKT